MATGPEHYREAERLAEQADSWMDADIGWKAHLPTEERIARRRADLDAAQVHATLALAAATALATMSSRAAVRTVNEWWAAAGPQQPKDDDTSE
ncbi:hypothetical protein ACFOOM_12315 [Streptomyces echinoruber]|uniref:Uncharacterized protein n=1 Tax=Streptomyces echinoruber TaxID=68898 RepID=A0A918VID9_9ACTN|nr:hypothetical protein [Streptomyces echinoruber]GHA01228.1 hypothetical protein GCM10010389_45700 [Streptomyces echinoruber]